MPTGIIRGDELSQPGLSGGMLFGGDDLPQDTATLIQYFLAWRLQHQHYTERYDGRHTIFSNTIWIEEIVENVLAQAWLNYNRLMLIKEAEKKVTKLRS